MAEAALRSTSVQRVRDALQAAGIENRILRLGATAHSAREAAAAIGCEVGAIVKSLVFVIDEQPVMALVSGDRQCRAEALPDLLNLSGVARRATADRVRAATGFAIGGVAPLGHPTALPTVIDVGIGRFRDVYAAAGHPSCVFRTSLDELRRLTGGRVSDRVGRG